VACYYYSSSDIQMIAMVSTENGPRRCSLFSTIGRFCFVGCCWKSFVFEVQRKIEVFEVKKGLMFKLKDTGSMGKVVN
jgi:hypothetical protein